MINKFHLYLTKFVTAKARHKLPYTALILYYIMAYLLKYRFVQSARITGELLQRIFSTNYAVNSQLAYVYRQMNNFEDECKTLMGIVPDNPHDIDLLTRAAETAAFAKDVNSLERLRDIAAQESTPMHYHIKGLLAYMNGEANYAVYFQEAVRSFLISERLGASDSSGESVGVLIQRASESGRSLPEYVRAASNIRELSIIDELLKGDAPSHTPPLLADDTGGTPISEPGLTNPIVLISCSEGYLNVWSDYYIRTFRSKNQNIIHFHVLADDIESTRDCLVVLKSKHSNIRYSIEALSGNSQTYITMARFLICRDIMKHYNSDVLISDIDLRVDFDIGPICRELRSGGFDFGFYDGGYLVPWSKFAAGCFSYFRVANHATDVYLDLLSRYLVWLYSNGGFFSMDQVGMMTIYEYMQARGHDFRMLNFNGLIDLRGMHKLPKKLQRGKIEVKFGNGAPQ